MIAVISAVIVYLLAKKVLKYINENNLEDGTDQWGAPE